VKKEKREEMKEGKKPPLSLKTLPSFGRNKGERGKEERGKEMEWRRLRLKDVPLVSLVTGGKEREKRRGGGGEWARALSAWRAFTPPPSLLSRSLQRGGGREKGEREGKEPPAGGWALLRWAASWRPIRAKGGGKKKKGEGRGGGGQPAPAGGRGRRLARGGCRRPAASASARKKKRGEKSARGDGHDAGGGEKKKKGERKEGGREVQSYLFLPVGAIGHKERGKGKKGEEKKGRRKRGGPPGKTISASSPTFDCSRRRRREE